LRAKRRWVENVTDITKAAALSNPAFFKEAMTIRATSPQGHLKLRNILHFALPVL
jgi:RNA polymerase sigma-70 factor (ECF subfamily)